MKRNFGNNKSYSYSGRHVSFDIIWDKYYGANAPLDYTVKLCFREFRCGRNNTSDEVRSSRLSDAVTQKNVKKRIKKRMCLLQLIHLFMFVEKS